MGNQYGNFSEIFMLILFLGSIVFIISTVYQLIVLTIFNKNIRWYKIIMLIVFTRLLSVFLTIFVWQFLFQEIEIMFGPFLLPGIISEIILSPLILKIFGFKLIKNNA